MLILFSQNKMTIKNGQKSFSNWGDFQFNTFDKIEAESNEAIHWKIIKNDTYKISLSDFWHIIQQEFKELVFTLSSTCLYKKVSHHKNVDEKLGQSRWNPDSF